MMTCTVAVSIWETPIILQKNWPNITSESNSLRHLTKPVGPHLLVKGFSHSLNHMQLGKMQTGECGTHAHNCIISTR